MLNSSNFVVTVLLCPFSSENLDTFLKKFIQVNRQLQLLSIRWLKIFIHQDW